jgi:amino acid transporter
VIKISTLLFISITGFVVLGGHTRVQNPTANFHNSFSGKATAYGATNGLYKIIFSYAGFENSFNVANEVKVRFIISSQGWPSTFVVYSSPSSDAFYRIP